jgi:hypothetical protein
MAGGNSELGSRDIGDAISFRGDIGGNKTRQSRALEFVDGNFSREFTADLAV